MPTPKFCFVKWLMGLVGMNPMYFMFNISEPQNINVLSEEQHNLKIGFQKDPFSTSKLFLNVCYYRTTIFSSISLTQDQVCQLSVLSTESHLAIDQKSEIMVVSRTSPLQSGLEYNHNVYLHLDFVYGPTTDIEEFYSSW